MMFYRRCCLSSGASIVLYMHPLADFVNFGEMAGMSKYHKLKSTQFLKLGNREKPSGLAMLGAPCARVPDR